MKSTENITVKYIESPKLKNPTAVVGLPGVGNVGKLAVEHLKDVLKAKKFISIYSKHFPPQVMVSDEGIVRLVSNDFYYWKAEKKEQHDLILLTGDYQGLTPEGQYELSNKILDILSDFNLYRIYTLGGYGMGKMIDAPRVLGAATNAFLVKEMKKQGAVFPKGEPGNGIVGASGLILGLGAFRGLDCVCLMGETSGYFVDPKSARAVLGILKNLLKIEIDFSELEHKASQIDKITSQLKDMESPIEGGVSQQEDLRYIG